MARNETFCASFCRQAVCSGDPDSQPCAVCGWTREEHVTYQHLEEAAMRREARLIVDRGRFRLYIYRGFRYQCMYSIVDLWARPAGNTASSYRGTRSSWEITARTPDTGRRRAKAKQEKPSLDQPRNVA